VAEESRREREEINDDLLVSGQILIPAGADSFEGATAHIRLEEIPSADMAARVIGETIIDGVRHENNAEGRETVVPFTIRVPRGARAIDRQFDYAVRVWIDRDSDGRPGAGDLYSDERYPVLTQGFGHTANVRVVQR
jgi:hypothetical protein